MRMSEELKELIEKLPPDLQKEVKDFVEFLVEKNIKRRKKRKIRTLMERCFEGTPEQILLRRTST
jgi:hypothetical protein